MASAKETRRLVAIMFADIVGYTRLMEQDENMAKDQLEKFRRVLKEQVRSFNGQIVNFYGDGCLAIFENAVQASTCAISIQQQFAESPLVPVRIGLHSGAVNVGKEHVYGNAVNLTSRIESLGITGSILLSKRVRDELRNQPDFLMVSLGKFAFKHVEEPLEVFALANEGLLVPKRTQIEGKLRPKKRSAFITSFSLIFLVLLIAGWFFWNQNKQRSPLPEEILESRIAVLPFENKTNDSDLEMLGDMAADWITRNLMNLEDIKIVRFENVANNLETLQQDPDLFVRRTGTEKMIKGRFYREGAELIFESQIVDPKTAEVIFALPPIRGSLENPSQIVSELSQRVAGYFAISESIFKRTDAPKLEAYAAVEQGNKYFGSDDQKARSYYQRAIALDSNFLLPRTLTLTTYLNQGRFDIADSLFQILRSKSGYASRFEKLQVDFFQAILEFDMAKEYQVAQEIFEIDPKHLVNNYQSGQTALLFNRPGKTVENYQQMDPHTIELKIPAEFWWFSNYAQALIRLERYEQAMDMLSIVPRAKNPFYGIRQHIYTLQNQADSLENLIGEMEKNGLSEDRILQHMYKIAWDYGARGDRKNQIAWGQRMLKRIQGRPESVQVDPKRPAEAYFITENYEEAVEAYEIYKQQYGETWIYLMDVGCIYAKMGNEKMAKEFIKKLQERENRYSRGTFKYAQALIYASMDQREEAMRLLRQAFGKGYGFGLWSYDNSYLLVPLHGYPPYEEFVRPKN